MSPERDPKPQSEPSNRDRVMRGPIGGHLAALVRRILIRLRFTELAEHYDSTIVLGVFSFINGCLSIAIMSTVALLSGQPFIFPSLGPTAFLFFYSPLAPAASPRNATLGHLIGAAAGWGSLWVFGLQDVGPAISTGVDTARIGAAALSLGLTSGLMVLFRAPHPPAGATTLIISLGILRTFEQVSILMIAVILLTIQALVINRFAGLPYPLWSAPSESQKGKR